MKNFKHFLCGYAALSAIVVKIVKNWNSKKLKPFKKMANSILNDFVFHFSVGSFTNGTSKGWWISRGSRKISEIFEP